jgi:hypothetical protein
VVFDSTEIIGETSSRSVLVQLSIYVSNRTEILFKNVSYLQLNGSITQTV